MSELDPSAFRVSGWLLVVGAAFAIVGAFCPPYRQWYAPEEEGLRAIAGNPIGWWCIHIGFFVGTVVSMLGLAALGSALYRREGGEFALIAAVAFGIAATAFIGNLAYRLSVWNWAAETFVATGHTPEAFVPLKRRAGMLFSVFSLLGYASVACLGGAMLRAELGPGWLGWATVLCGLSAGFVVGHNVPFIMYVPLAALGVVLLRAG